jgi:hypothetical protein
MDLDFRKLGHFDQQKAVANLIRLEDSRPNYIAYLLANEQYDLYSWFELAKTTEGWEYWYNLKNKIDEEV